MSQYQILPTKAEDIAYVAARMREADVQDVWAAGHKKPYDALAFSVARSLEAKTGAVDGRPICIFGVGPITLLSDMGVPWLLSTDEMPRHALKFLKESKLCVRDWRKRYSVLANMVDCRNRIAIKWLKWLGFQIYPPVSYGPDKLPFHPFVLRGEQ